MWHAKEIRFLSENYSKNISLEEIAKNLNKTVKSIKRKAERLHLSRPRFPSNKISKKTPKKIIDRKYYLNHKNEIYARKQSRRKEIKEELVNFLGGKCKLCGYNKCSKALDFHHTREDKEECVSKLISNFSKKKILKEAKKCVLLCANCHRELHSMGA